MIQLISNICEIQKNQINIKANNEKLGLIGKEKASLK